MTQCQKINLYILILVLVSCKSIANISLRKYYYSKDIVVDKINSCYIVTKSKDTLYNASKKQIKLLINNFNRNVFIMELYDLENNLIQKDLVKINN